MACGGGFDFKMVDGAAKEMYCVICTLFTKGATMFNCGHVFCNVCAVEFIQSSKQRNVKVQCPVRCDKEIYPKHLADFVDCPNKCGKRMSKDEVHTHLEICPAQLVSCPFHNIGCLVSMLRNSIQEHMKLSVNDHLLLVVADSQKTKAESTQLQHELQQEMKLLKENGNKQQKKIDLLEEGEKLRKHEIGILKVNIEEQQKEIKLLKEKEKNQETEIEELKNAIEKKQDVLPPSPEIEKHLQEISERKLGYINELLQNKNTSPSTFRQLLHNPHIIDMRSDYNSTIFHYAVKFNRADVLELLSSVYPSHIDDVDDYNWTALMCAVYHNHIECVRVLLINNADVSIKPRYGKTSLSLARKKNYVDIIRLLEEHRKQHRATR